MEHKILNWHGKTYYLLGEDADGIRYYLVEPNFDCGWYWGGLYIQSFTNNRNPTASRDIRSHEHFDNLFLNKGHFGPENFKERFVKTTIGGDNNKWKMLELAETFYCLRRAADLFHIGGSHITTNPCEEIVKDREIYEEIVKRKLPAICAEIVGMLGGEKTADYFASKVRIID